MVNKFGFIGKSSDTFGFTKTLPNYHYSRKLWPNFGLLCVANAQFQISFDSFDPSLPPATASHSSSVCLFSAKTQLKSEEGGS